MLPVFVADHQGGGYGQAIVHGDHKHQGDRHQRQEPGVRWRSVPLFCEGGSEQDIGRFCACDRCRRRNQCSGFVFYSVRLALRHR